jgi:hypothetical protein
LIGFHRLCRMEGHCGIRFSIEWWERVGLGFFRGWRCLVACRIGGCMRLSTQQASARNIIQRTTSKFTDFLRCVCSSLSA